MNINTKHRIARTPWGTVAPSSRSGVVIHHSVTPEGGSAAGAEAQVRNVNRMHPNGSYNYIVDYLGRVWEIVGLNNVGAHAYQANTPNWGICYLGDGRYNFTDAAEKSIKELIGWLQGHAGKTLSVRGHGQVNRTACPGGIIQARINAGAFGAPHSGGSTPAGGGADGAFPARNLYGHNWVVAAQNKLLRLGYDLGPWGADGKDGATTQAAVRDLQKRGGTTQDGIYGPQTDAVANRLLGGSGGVKAPAFPLKTGWYFGPQHPLTNVRSVSGYHGNREHLRRWQQRMKDRGWNINPDGLYGNQTATVARAFQAEKGLHVDGLIGAQTWRAAWEAPIT